MLAVHPDKERIENMAEKRVFAKLASADTTKHHFDSFPHMSTIARQ